MQFSKSDYMMFLRHPAWLWLKKKAPRRLPPTDPGTQALFDAGHLFESYAEKKFAGAMRLGFDGYDEYRSLTKRTTDALTAGVPIIHQARFESGDLTCICDVVINTGGGAVDLIEIKASSEVKKDHEYDLAFQTAVIEGSGFTVRTVSVVYVNTEYVRRGEIDPDGIGVTADVTNAIRMLREETERNIVRMRKTVAHTTLPDLSPSRAGLDAFKDWLTIYRTLVTLPPYSIYDLTRLNAELVADLEREGIERIIDIPEGVTLGVQQQRQVAAVRENRVHIDRGEIRAFLDGLSYPLYFLDYETFMRVIPPFDGMRPYAQIPFQYSLHMLDKPGGALRVTGYLHTENSDPIVPLSRKLASEIGPTGTVLAWFAPFERSRNTEMGERCPEFASFYNDINGRMLDLMDPFREGHYVHKDFLGRSSIKSVLPVLVPELSYKDLEIQEGGSASRLWAETVLDGRHEDEREKILHALDTYCTMDTLAMVKIYEKLLAQK